MRCLIVGVFFICMTGAMIFAQSQQPTPAPTKSIAKPQADAKKENTSATNKPSGTLEIPFFVKIIPTDDPAGVASKSAHKEQNYSSAEWWLVYVSIALTTFTLGLMCYTAKLWGATQDALEKTERPYIYVFGPDRLRVDKHVVGGFEPFLTYTVANYGKTPAHVQEAFAEIIPGIDRVPEISPDERIHLLLRSPILAPEERRDDNHRTLPSGMGTSNPSPDEIVPQLNEPTTLYFRVLVRYRGPFSSGHESSFCWRYDGNINRFNPFGGDEYNYVK